MSGLQVRKRGYALGAEVRGVDLSERLDDATVDALRDAWLQHIVLCFPDQHLGAEELRAFSSRFGELDDNRAGPHVRHLDNDDVMVLVSRPTKLGEREYVAMLSDFWHTDFSHTDRPGSAAFLAAQRLPDIGGDTMFANAYTAYETLSPAFRALLDPLEAVHDVTVGTLFAKFSPELQEERRKVSTPHVHPLVRTHPETGRKCLYIGTRIRQFAGMSEEESKPLVDFLNRHATRPEFVYRHTWKPGDVVMWDNRCTLHYAVQDYDHSQPRRLLRCSVLPPKSGYPYQTSDTSEERNIAGRS